MGKNPAMQLYVNDWLSSPKIMTMTPLQELAYFRMLLFCWASGDASITPDLETLSQLTRTDSNTCSTVVQQAFNEHPNDSSKLTNPRLFELWQERVQFNEQRRQAGIASGAKRAKTDGNNGKVSTSNKRSTSVQRAGAVSLNSSSSSSSALNKEQSDQLKLADGGSKPFPSSKKKEAEAGRDSLRASKKEQTAQIAQVVEYYQTLHPKARPGEKEEKLIAARLKKFSVDELKNAIDGNHLSPHHCGANDTQTKYHKLALIMRDNGQVTAFIEIFDEPPGENKFVTPATKREHNSDLATSNFVEFMGTRNNE